MLAATAGTLTIQALSPTRGRVLQTWSFSRATARVSVGRGSKNDVVINSNVISRHHATLEKVGGTWHLQNLGKNGCLIDDRRVDRYPLIGKTLIRLGRTGSYLLVSIENELSASQTTQDFTLVQNRFDTSESTVTDTFERLLERQQ